VVGFGEVLAHDSHELALAALAFFLVDLLGAGGISTGRDR
jgi:hypothetical protein